MELERIYMNIWIKFKKEKTSILTIKSLTFPWSALRSKTSFLLEGLPNGVFCTFPFVFHLVARACVLEHWILCIVFTVPIKYAWKVNHAALCLFFLLPWYRGAINSLDSPESGLKTIQIIQILCIKHIIYLQCNHMIGHPHSHKSNQRCQKRDAGERLLLQINVNKGDISVVGIMNVLEVIYEQRLFSRWLSPYLLSPKGKMKSNKGYNILNLSRERARRRQFSLMATRGHSCSIKKIASLFFFFFF